MSGVQACEMGGFSNSQETLIANSATLDPGDFVTLDGDGFLARSAAGDKIEGFSVRDSVTVAADNETVGLIKGQWQPIDDNMTFWLTADQAPAQTDIGAYCNIAVSGGGAITANLAATTEGQLQVIEIDITNTKVKVKVAEPQQLAFAQV